MFKRRSYLVSLNLIVMSILFVCITDTARADDYKIKWGDTLSQLAIDFQTTTFHLIKINNIENADFIYAGNTLILPSVVEEKDTHLLNNDQDKENDIKEKSVKNAKNEKSESEEATAYLNKAMNLNNVIELNPFKK